MVADLFGDAHIWAWKLSRHRRFLAGGRGLGSPRRCVNKAECLLGPLRMSCPWSIDVEGDAAVTGGTRQAEAPSPDFSPSLNWEEPEGEAVAKMQRAAAASLGIETWEGAPLSTPLPSTLWPAVGLPWPDPGAGDTRGVESGS